MESQPATPDVASKPVNPNVTGWLYQPLWSGGRAGTAPVTAGGVWSTRTVAVWVTVPDSTLVTLQVTSVPGVSPATTTSVPLAHAVPATAVSKLESKIQCTVTGLVCQ